MKKVIIGIVSSLLVLIIAGAVYWQNKVNRPYKLLLHADTLMLERPDSALQVLKSITGPQNLYGENQALYALLMTQARYKNYLPVENDSLIRFAVDYYAEGKDSLRKAWSCFYMARVCQNMKDKKRSLNYYQKAATAAEGCDNYKLLDLLYYYWGILLQPEKPYEEGLSKLMKAKEYGELNKDTTSLINTLGKIAWSYVWKGEYQLAEIHLLDAIRLAQQKNKQQLDWLYHHLSVTYQQNKQFTKALEYINKALKDTYPDNQDFKTRLFIKGSIFTDLQQYDSARYYINRGEKDDNLYSIADYQNQMSKIEEGIGNTTEALKWSRLYSSYQDSIELSERENNLMELQKKYDYTLIQNENIQLKNKSQKKDIITQNIIIVLISLLFISYYIYNKVNKKKEKIIQNKDKQLTESRNQLQQKTNELLQNKQTVQEKEAELNEYIQKEKSLRENISKQEKQLDFYIEQQQNLKEQIFRMNKTVKRIEQISTLQTIQKDRQAKQLKLSKEELEELISVINFRYDTFETRLRANYSSFDDTDIYICCLLKMNVRSQDISYLLAINDDTLKKRKYRIKKGKMGITQEGISLNDFLKDY